MCKKERTGQFNGTFPYMGIRNRNSIQGNTMNIEPYCSRIQQYEFSYITMSLWGNLIEIFLIWTSYKLSTVTYSMFGDIYRKPIYEFHIVVLQMGIATLQNEGDTGRLL